MIVSLFSMLCCVWGCAAENHSVVNDTRVTENALRIAVWPFSNRSRSPAPIEDMRRLFIDSLKGRGVNIVDEETVQKFLETKRIRHVGSISRKAASDLKWETGADAVLLTTLELYSVPPPPKIALISRLVSTGSNPKILWIDGVGMAGDDSIGLLELSLILDPQKLLRKALPNLPASLATHLSGRRYWTTSDRSILKFWPKLIYRSPVLEPGRKYTVAVIPFFNESERRFAGEIVTLHFVRKLTHNENFSVSAPGLVRDTMLEYRIVMDDGISIADADLLFSKLDVDLILSGLVFDYQDYEGPLGKPKVGFSAMLMERQSLEVVWACQSHNVGDHGVFFFDWGKINTAHAMASEMVQSALETLVE
jgi:hypothetical protein